MKMFPRRILYLAALAILAMAALCVITGISGETSAASLFTAGLPAPAEVVEETVTLSAADVKTWLHYDEWYSKAPYCGPPFKVGPTFEDYPGSVVAGYKHLFDKGAKVFGCPERLNWNYRGTVWFDLGDIVAKAPPLHVYVKKATLKFQALDRECPVWLLIASKDWSKGYPDNELVPGDPFTKIESCGREGCNIDVQTVVNNWVRGEANGGYANYGFVVRGELEGPVDDNEACPTRYGDFRLTVTYTYERKDTVLRIPSPQGPAIMANPAILDTRKNVALASNGATASAQAYTADGVYPGLHFQPSFAIDGLRHTTADGGNLWRDEHGLASWLEVAFPGIKKITEIDVVTVQNPGYEKAVDPTETQPFTQQGARGFEVQYWTGSDWATPPGGSISGNSRVWTRISFAAIATTKIRVLVNDSSDRIARIVELEAWGR